MHFREVEVSDFVEAVFVSLGEASSCWDHLDRAGAFDAARAKAIGDDLVKFIEGHVLKPNLGMATTAELLEEVSTRMAITQNSLSGRELGRMCLDALNNLAPGVLAYRTVDN